MLSSLAALAAFCGLAAVASAQQSTVAGSHRAHAKTPPLQSGVQARWKSHLKGQVVVAQPPATHNPKRRGHHKRPHRAVEVAPPAAEEAVPTPVTPATGPYPWTGTITKPPAAPPTSSASDGPEPPPEEEPTAEEPGDEEPAGEEPTGEEPTGEEPSGEEPAGEEPTTPPVEGSRNTNCFVSPSACGFPDPTNTGVPAGVTLTPRGTVTINQAGTVLSGVDVTGTIEINAANVTVENSRVTQTSTCGRTSSCGNYAIRIAPGLRGVRIAHVETRTAAGATCEQDIRNTGAELTIEASYLHACDGNIYAVGPTVLKDSYGIAKIEISADHIENVYFNETSFSAIHSTLFNPVNQTAVIFGNSGGGVDVSNCSNRLTIHESLLAGGGYSLYPCAHSSQPGSSVLDVQGNHFARCLSTPIFEANGGHHPCSGGFDSHGYYPNSGSYGIATDYYSGTGTWRGNVWDDNLERVCLNGGNNGCE